MKLLLDHDDLLPEYADIGCAFTKYEHFNGEAQRAIDFVGKAMFKEWDKSNYNVIYAERKEKR